MHPGKAAAGLAEFADITMAGFVQWTILKNMKERVAANFLWPKAREALIYFENGIPGLPNPVSGLVRFIFYSQNLHKSDIIYHRKAVLL
jgi:hypothetical protein